MRFQDRHPELQPYCIVHDDCQFDIGLAVRERYYLKLAYKPKIQTIFDSLVLTEETRGLEVELIRHFADVKRIVPKESLGYKKDFRFEILPVVYSQDRRLFYPDFWDYAHYPATRDFLDQLTRTDDDEIYDDQDQGYVHLILRAGDYVEFVRWDPDEVDAGVQIFRMSRVELLARISIVTRRLIHILHHCVVAIGGNPWNFNEKDYEMLSPKPPAIPLLLSEK